MQSRKQNIKAPALDQRAMKLDVNRPPHLLSVILQSTIFLLCMLCIHPAFGGRLPEAKPADAPLHAPARPSDTHADITGQPNALTDTLPPVQATVPNAPKPAEANASTQSEQMQAHSQHVWQSIQRNYCWFLGPLIGLVLLVAGLAGRKHVRDLGEGKPARVRKQRRTHNRPKRRLYLSEGWQWALGLAALLALVAGGVVLGSLILGTLASGFGLTVIALVLPVALVIGAVLLFGRKFLTAINIDPDNAKPGGGLKGCLRFFFFWFFIICVVTPILIGIAALLVGLALFILLGTSVMPGLLALATIAMIGCTVLGLFVFFAIRDKF